MNNTFIVKRCTEMDFDFIPEIIVLDQLVYKDEHLGSYESISSRYLKNKDSFLFLLHHEK